MFQLKSERSPHCAPITNKSAQLSRIFWDSLAITGAKIHGVQTDIIRILAIFARGDLYLTAICRAIRVCKHPRNGPSKTLSTDKNR